MQIQTVFRLIKEGDKNAFLFLNIFFNSLVNDNGEITIMYRKYGIRSHDQEDINFKIKLKLIEQILMTDKLNNIEEKINLKWYLKKMTSNFIHDHFREIQKNYNFDYEKDEGELQFLENSDFSDIDIEEIDWEQEYVNLYKEILEELPSKKCKEIFQLSFEGVTTKEIINILNNSGWNMQDPGSLSSSKHECKKELVRQVKKHNKYSEWKEVYLKLNN